MAILSFSDLEEKCILQNKTIYEIAEYEEAKLSEVDIDVVRLKVLEDLLAMKEAVKNGLKSKEKAISGWCGDDCAKLIENFQKRGAIFGKTFEKITEYALATAEENLRMGRIVACPTAGSCGIVPSVIIAVSEEKNIAEAEQINGLLTAGIVGLTVVGALISSTIKVTIPITFQIGEVSFAIQDQLNSIFLYLPQIALVATVYWLSGKKKMTTTKLIFIVMISGIILAALGIIA